MQLDESNTDLGRWRTASQDAAPPLRSHVRGYFGCKSFIPNVLSERRLPTMGVALMINLATPHRLVERDAGDIGWGARAWVVGLQTRPRLSEASGDREFLAVSLTPTGAWRLLRTPMDELTDRIVNLEDIDPTFASRLLAEVEAARGWSARFASLDRAFLGRLGDVSAPPPIALDLLARLSAREGDVGRIAGELGRSHRWLITRFREQVGLPPKAVARLQRFNRALAAINETRRVNWPQGKPYLEVQTLAAARPLDWTQLALACGYYDQAHFINEFRAFAGAAPGAFSRAIGPGPTPA